MPKVINTQTKLTIFEGDLDDCQEWLEMVNDLNEVFPDEENETYEIID